MDALGLVTTGAVGLAGIVAVLLLVGWTRTEVSARGDAQDKQLAAEAERAKVERDRDDERAGRVKAEAERDGATRERDVYAAAAKAAREELTKHVRETLATGTDDDAVAEVDRLLGEPLPSVRGAGAATSDGGGSAGPAAVRPPG